MLQAGPGMVEEVTVDETDRQGSGAFRYTAMVAEERSTFFITYCGRVPGETIFLRSSLMVQEK